MTTPILYSVVDSNGEMLYSRITADPEYPVQIGNRLVRDVAPELLSGQQLTRVTPVPAGQDFVEYIITDELDEHKASRIRKSRDDLLSSCDWTQLADCQLSDEQKGAWVTYRQQLRDITAQPEFPSSVNWPVAP